MESFVQFRKGETPHHVHRDLDGLKDEELGRYGFVGRQAQLYRENDPTAYTAEGDISLTDVLVEDLEPTDLTDASGRPLELFRNADVRFLLSRRTEPMPFFARNVGGDELFFVHRGTGIFETEFGPIPYEPGDWVLLPKAVTYRHVPEAGAEQAFLIIEAVEEFRVPEPGILGRHFPFDSSCMFVPEPEVHTEGGPTWQVRLTRRDETSVLTYQHHPFDVRGWKGDYFPFKYNIRDYNVIYSESVHLPPTNQLFLQAEGVVVLNFLPRPAESREGTERLPWYHRNADYDEVALFHSGDLFGVQMPPGLLSHAPQGIHHGPPERARARARRKFAEYDRVNWSVMSIDCRKPLTVNPEIRRISQEQA
ncbi:homogentisate 1,2-dioxygenase [Nocardioides insulae]|uniref:homogentisate 1,2-dioxygenase n=1 Tax=Nocardioides insulae TaxID=394734 RepID=UPI0004250972|nr:homogentisate 1,2-dioxygenase [Nocardioides insulae]